MTTPDLNLTGEQDPSDKSYFEIPVTGLKLNSFYTVQFQWVFADNSLNNLVKSIWSPGYGIATSTLTALPKPKFISSDLTYSQGLLRVKWGGLDYQDHAYGPGFKRINVYVKDNSSPANTFYLAGFIERADGVFTLPTKPVSHTVRLTTVSVLGEESFVSAEQTVTPINTPPADPTSVVAEWSGTDFTVSFTHDTAASDNSNLLHYLVQLNPPSPNPSKIFTLPPTSGSSQKFSLSLEQNQAVWGSAQTQFSGIITAVDYNNNRSSLVSFSNTQYATSLTTPTITATEVANGYVVSYTQQTSNTFSLISIEEVESTASTAPSTGYSVVKTDTANPSTVPTVNNNKRWVRARLKDTVNAFTSYSNAVAVTPISPVTVDVDGPDNVTTVTTSGGLDSNGIIGFNGYADISWNSVTGGGIRGYRIRYKATTSSVYSYADSPGAGTSYRLTGLGAGLTYEIAVATYDEYNNTSSSYVSGTNVEVGGTPYIASTVDVTGYFKAKANSGDADSTAFKFGYGVDTGKRGLVFNANNYWYIDSNQSASLKVGGATTNYIQWDGAKFTIDGNLQAKQGTFSGNVQLASGASVYSGTLTGETVETSVVDGVTITTKKSGGSLSGAGYILNSSGLTFSSASVAGITTIDATTGKITTKSANIGGWLIDDATKPNQIYKTSGTSILSLDSSTGEVKTTGTGFSAGFGIPDSNNIVFWSGSSRATTAPFWVKADGSVNMSGTVTIGSGATSGNLTDLLDGKVGPGQVKDNLGGTGITTISGSIITTGAIKSSNFSGTADGTSYATAGTAFDLVNGTITSKKFRIDSNGDAFFLGTLSSGIAITAPVITGGSLSIGEKPGGGYYFSVDSSGTLRAEGAIISGTITAAALYINATNYINSSSAFSLGGGSLTYSGSGVISVNSTTFNFTNAPEMVDGDNNNYGGDSTVVLGPGGNLTKGRAFHYGGATVPGSTTLSRYVKNSATGQYVSIPFVSGDVWLTVD